MTHPSGAAVEPAFARADLLQLLAREFGSRGGDIGAVLDRRGIAPDTMIDADALVEASALYGAAEDMAAELGDIHFGAKVGKAAAAHGAHMLRGTAETARTLGDFFIGAILETDRRTNSVTYGLQVGPQAAVFEIHRRRETDPHPVQIDAGLLVFYTTMLSECLGPVSYTHLTLPTS